MRLEDHWLADATAHHIPSPNVGNPFSGSNPDTIIIHFTDGDSVAAAVEILCDPQKKVSAHVVVGRDGSLTQLVSFEHVAWHAGESCWGNRAKFNHYSLGIEVQNAGRLQRRGDRFFSSSGIEYANHEVCEAIHRNEIEPTYWHTYPAVQLDSVNAVCELLVSNYGIHHILGHEEIAPQRKIDPGPAFSLDKLRHCLLYNPQPARPTT